jgi:Na+:H+ antiporter, NhaA family
MMEMHATVLPPPPPTPIQRILSPFARFIHTESSGGMVLIGATLTALVWANSPLAESYHHLWETPVSVGFGEFALTYSLHHWINDALMAVFFFMVGLEIKREILVGELASLKRAALPIAAAIGGMVVPALLYTAVNAGGPGARGWGIPMATDIAFALGVLMLLGPRTPLALKVFLAALAIVDDIGAVLVIAVFYTERISLEAIAFAAIFMGALVMANRLGVRRPPIYLFLGILLWIAFLKSGIHPTVAGVLSAMAIPARTRIDTTEFLARGRRVLDHFEATGEEGPSILTNRGQQAALEEMERNCEAAMAPLQTIEHDLQFWVAFTIIPLFALANAGVRLSGDASSALLNPVTLGVVLGLVIGKPIGITLFAWAAVRMQIASMPLGVGWRAVAGVACLGGIGFTMSLFIGGLAFQGMPVLNDAAKIGIFAASLVAGLAGWGMLRAQIHHEEVDEDEGRPEPRAIPVAVAR